MSCADDCQDLPLESVIGFSGSVPNGLQYTPCGGYIVYSLGSVAVIKSVVSGNQTFLDGKTSQLVSCVAVARDGCFLATGHKTEVGAKAETAIWDLQKAIMNCKSGKPSSADCILHCIRQHVGKVQALDFSCDASFLVTLGGQDDKDVVVFKVSTGVGICGNPAAKDDVFCVKWLNKRNDRFVTCGKFHLKVWQICAATPTMHAIEANMGVMRREMQCLSISDDDVTAFAGGTTGEVIDFQIDRDEMKPYNEPDVLRPTLRQYSRHRFSRGVKSVACVVNPVTGNTAVLAGAGDGMLQLLNPKLELIKTHKAELCGAVTSISLAPDSKTFLVGTHRSQRYSVDVATFNVELRGTCHYGEIYDVKFPKQSSDLFVTASVQDIRVWNAQKKQELARIQVPNMSCHAIDITLSGSSILSAWSDGTIRSFSPQSAKIKFIIPDAHIDGVTALTTCNEDDRNPDWRIVSGGVDGRVRVWKITKSHQTMMHSMKEHRGTINGLTCNSKGTQAISASADGSCIVWDLGKGVRIHALLDPTMFTAALYHPDESQYLTCGTNYKIGYWDAFDGSAIRVIEGGAAEMTSLAIQERDGAVFASGSADRTVRIWNYDDGITIGLGTGHSGRVNRVALSPNRRLVVSVGSEGAIFIFDVSNIIE